MPEWIKSSTSFANGNCVEVARVGDTIAVRHSAHPETVLTFTLDEWTAFLEGTALGEFDDLAE